MVQYIYLTIIIWYSLWHNNSGSEPSWYVSHILVRDLQNDEKYYFILNRWLAVNKDDERVFK